MPVRPGRDQHRVDVAAVEQLAIVAVHIAIVGAVLLIDHFLDQRTASFFHVAHGGEPNVALLQETTEVVQPPVPDADTADNDPLTGSNGTVQTQR